MRRCETCIAQFDGDVGLSSVTLPRHGRTRFSRPRQSHGETSRDWVAQVLSSGGGSRFVRDLSVGGVTTSGAPVVPDGGAALPSPELTAVGLSFNVDLSSKREQPPGAPFDPGLSFVTPNSGARIANCYPPQRRAKRPPI